MSMKDAMRYLNSVYIVNDCECVDKPPYTKCKMCTSAHALNEIGEIARDAIEEIDGH